MRRLLLALLVISSANVSPLGAQSPAAVDTPPPYLLLGREEVRPGKGAAHVANEAAWAAAMTKGQSPVRWLGMNSLLGPSEAWFLSRYQSYADWAKADGAFEAMKALKTENDRFAGLEGDMLSRTSNVFLRLRGGLSYQPEVTLSKMRYMSVDIMRVKQGYITPFLAAWRMQVAAHKEAKMDEHWAVYEVVGGGMEGTFMFFYPMESMEGLDRSGPMHGDEAFGKAVGEAGRNQMREFDRTGMESSQTLLFQLMPSMSVSASPQ